MAVLDVDAVVVGAGAMGASTAWHLARRGRRVVLLEQFGRGHDRGSSHGASRVFRLAYRDPRYVGLAARALPLWRELEAEAETTLLEQTGQLDHGFPAALDEIEANLRAAHRPVARLTSGQARERWPGMRFEGTVLLSPDGGRCRADATVDALLRRAAHHGADLHFSTPVERITVEDVAGSGPAGRAGRASVHTAFGSWRAPAVVLAAGAWLGRLVQGIRDASVGLPPLTVTLEQPADFRPHDPDVSWPSFLHHVSGQVPGQDNSSPLGVAAYGVFSPGGRMKVGEHGSGHQIDPDVTPRRVDGAGLARLSRYVEEWLPGLDPEPAAVSTCLYTTTPSEHFVLDRSGPLVICSPCSGHGFKFVPAIGAIVADLASGATQAEPAWRLGD